MLCLVKLQWPTESSRKVISVGMYHITHQMQNRKVNYERLFHLTQLLSSHKNRGLIFEDGINAKKLRFWFRCLGAQNGLHDPIEIISGFSLKID